MAHRSFSYKGYDIYLAALQLSKVARGGKQRSLQVRLGNVIKKQVRYNVNDAYGHAKASKKCTDWIDLNPLN